MHYFMLCNMKLSSPLAALCVYTVAATASAPYHSKAVELSVTAPALKDVCRTEPVCGTLFFTRVKRAQASMWALYACVIKLW